MHILLVIFTVLACYLAFVILIGAAIAAGLIIFVWLATRILRFPKGTF